MAFKVVDDPTIDTTSRTGKLVMGILALMLSSRTTSAGNARWTALPRLRREEHASAGSQS